MEGLHGNGEILIVKKSEPILARPAEETEGGSYFLSNLDINILVTVETIYCFKADDRKMSANASKVLKEALSKVLVHYYPLAGRFAIDSDGKLTVGCSGEGVVFVEAVAEHEIEILGDISKPDPVHLGKLVHTYHGVENFLEMPLLTTQVTKFRCGGFVLGISLNHCMADGLCAMEFINSWAETTRGVALTTPPILDRTILRSRQPPKIDFPHQEFTELVDESNIAALYKGEEMMYKSFDFNPERLARLKILSMEDGIVKNCTSFMVISALVWRARSKALKMEPHQQTKLLLAVDVRSKFNPPLPKGYFGNGILLTCCLCSAGELIEKPLSFSVKLVQEAIKLVTEDYVRSSIDVVEVTRTRFTLTSTFLISAWTRLSFHNADFGWGEPAQAGPATVIKELVVFLPGKGGKGTNVVLGLPVSSMKTFEEMIQM